LVLQVHIKLAANCRNSGLKHHCMKFKFVLHKCSSRERYRTYRFNEIFPSLRTQWIR